MTNYEEILNNMTVNKLAFLMKNVPAFCPYNYGCSECKHYNPDNIGLCFSDVNWDKEDYINWLESEVKE